MKKSRWDDYYARLARDEDWLARSVFKLKEMDKRFGLIRKGDRVLDLGCYPGSWSQYATRKVGSKGQVVGIDVKPPNRFSALNFRYIKGDVLALDAGWLTSEVGPRNVVLSDLAPQTTGVKSTDTARSVTLSKRALELALGPLTENGHFVCKVFEGEELRVFRSGVAIHFTRLRIFRPYAVRKRSREVYLLGLGRLKK